MSEERPVIERGSGPRRLTYVLTRRAELTRPVFQRYWWETHGPLVTRHAPERLRRYVQVHTVLDAEDFPGRRTRNAPPPYDGLALLWYDDAYPGRSPEADAAARPLIQEDEARFIDWSRSPLWMGVEHVIVER
ncbi:MAG: EthD family reductase [Chloroflexi bacterium]|nr:EthD family reductase [Chloroflexota bacterium]